MSSTQDKLALGLIALGLLQIGAEGLESAGELVSVENVATLAGRAIKGIASATCASPAPRILSVVKGFETFSTRAFIVWNEPDGRERSVELSSGVYARLSGPYQRRNAYGAALAYGPVLASNAATRPMLDAVLEHAFAGDAPLLGELGIDARARTGPLRIRYEPRAGAQLDGLPTVIGPARR